MDAKETLEIFNEKAKSLNNFLQANNSHRSVKISQGSAEVTGPTEEQTQAALLSLRMFMQNNDPLSVQNMLKLYEQEANEELLEKFQQVRNSLNTFLDSPSTLAKPLEDAPPEIPASGDPGQDLQALVSVINSLNVEYYTNREILEMFMYGNYSHLTQRDKFKQLAASYSVFALLAFWSVLDIFIKHLLQIKAINEELITALS